MPSAGTGTRRANYLRLGNTTGFSGVIWRPTRGKYEAYGTLNGKRTYLGLYEDVLDAGIAASDYRLQTEDERMAIRAAAYEALSASVQRVWANLTPDQRAQRVRNATLAQDIEVRRAAQKKSPVTTEQRRVHSKAGQLKRPFKERSASSLKGWEVRRAQAV